MSQTFPEESKSKTRNTLKRLKRICCKRNPMIIENFQLRLIFCIRFYFVWFCFVAVVGEHLN